MQMLPEVAGLISKDLSRAELVRCIRVSKSWNAAFIPCLYEHINYSFGRDLLSSPSWQGFQHHGHHMRKLSVMWTDFPPPGLFGPECCHLTTLELHADVGALPHYNLWSTRLITLVEQNPNIQTLELGSGIRPCSIDYHLSNVRLLRHLPQLRNLYLIYGKYARESTFQELLECAPRLERLEYQVQLDVQGLSSTGVGMESASGVNDTDQVVMNGDKTIMDRQMWTRLHWLSLVDNSGSRAAELVQHCPNLSHLKVTFWSAMEPHGVLYQIAQHFQGPGQYPSRLQHLEFIGLRGREAIKTLRILVKACSLPPVSLSRLKTFRLDSASYCDEIVTELLEHHSESLEEVVLAYCEPGPSGANVQGLLSRCPRLIHLELWSWKMAVYMEDIAQLPWICQNLEVLMIHLIGRKQSCKAPASEAETGDSSTVGPVKLQQHVWNEIGKLKRLRKLHTHTTRTIFPEATALSVANGGLEQLCGLRRLKEFQTSRDWDVLSDDDRNHLQENIPGLCILHP